MKRSLEIFCLTLILLSLNANAATIEGVPFVKQDPAFCGPASLSSVLSYHGASIDQSEIGKITHNERFKGSLITDLEAFARRKSFKTELGRGDELKLKTFVDRMTPVIVLVDLGFCVYSRPHYLVVIGYDEKGIIAHSGYESAKHYKYREFLKIWGKIGKTYLLIYR